MSDAFRSVGIPELDVDICVDVLISSDLRGIESHGIGRMRMYIDRILSGQQSPTTNLEIVKESPTTAVIDAHDGMGMVVGVKSMEIAIQKAREFGMGSVAVRNSTHFGINGYYPLMAVKANMIGMSFTNARPAVCPTFGIQPTLGTNPIAFGAPTDEECPFIFDAATSITQRGKIEVYAREEKSVPPDWVVDSANKPLQNAKNILQGFLVDSAALLPLGGKEELTGSHKGYGLSTMVEILSASLQSGAFLFGLSGIDPNTGLPSKFRVGHFFMALNIAAFTEVSDFRSITGNILRELRNTRKAPGHERIFTAGEKEYENELRVREEGIPIVPNLQKDICYIQNLLHLPDYGFNF